MSSSTLRSRSLTPRSTPRLRYDYHRSQITRRRPHGERSLKAARGFRGALQQIRDDVLERRVELVEPAEPSLDGRQVNCSQHAQFPTVSVSVFRFPFLFPVSFSVIRLRFRSPFLFPLLFLVLFLVSDSRLCFRCPSPFLFPLLVSVSVARFRFRFPFLVPFSFPFPCIWVFASGFISHCCFHFHFRFPWLFPLSVFVSVSRFRF